MSPLNVYFPCGNMGNRDGKCRILGMHSPLMAGPQIRIGHQGAAIIPQHVPSTQQIHAMPAINRPTAESRQQKQRARATATDDRDKQQQRATGAPLLLPKPLDVRLRRTTSSPTSCLDAHTSTFTHKLGEGHCGRHAKQTKNLSTETKENQGDLAQRTTQAQLPTGKQQK